MNTHDNNVNWGGNNTPS